MTDPNEEARIEAALAADREAGLRDAFAGGVLSAMIARDGVYAPHLSLQIMAQIRTAYRYADLASIIRKEPT